MNRVSCGSSPVSLHDALPILWSELEEVASTGRARVVLIHGPAGTGKSRLVEWICRRAHELGAATWCKATFAPEKAPGQALDRKSTRLNSSHLVSSYAVFCLTK